MNTLSTLFLLLFVLAAIFVAMHHLGKRYDWSAEARRKSIHILLGLSCLSFPWLFDNAWPVFALCSITLIALISLRLIPKARDSLGSSLHSIQRLSLGEILFPIAVTWSFVAAGEHALLYIISIAILTLADAGGALVGVRFGKNKFFTLGSGKSIEGSLCFFILAYLCIFLPLCFVSDVALSNILLIAFVLALLATIVEGISSHGFDNILLPVATLLLLKLFLQLDFSELVIRCSILSISLAFILALRKLSTLDGGGLLGAAFYAYACYAMGNAWFLSIGLVFYGIHLLINKRTDKVRESSHSIDSVIVIATTGLFWLTLHYTQILTTPIALLCFTFGLGAHLSMMCCNSCLLLGRLKPSYVYSLLPVIPLLTLVLFTNSAVVNALLIVIYLMALSISNRLFVAWHGGANSSSMLLILKQSLLALGLSSVGLLSF